MSTPGTRVFADPRPNAILDDLPMKTDSASSYVYEPRKSAIELEHEDIGIAEPTVIPLPYKGDGYNVLNFAASDKPKPGYHLAAIPRGTFGEFSKIEEEVAEAKDALQQGCKIMVLHELADIIGGIKGYLAKHHPGVTLGDLNVMATINERAFQNGQRVA